MQSQLFAALAPLSQKAGQAKTHAWHRGLQPFSVIPESNGLELTLDLPGVTCLDLFRAVPNHEFRHRHAGRGIAQGLAFDQDAGKFNAIQLILTFQFADCSAAGAGAAAACSS